jgi:hypothetical protein
LELTFLGFDGVLEEAEELGWEKQTKKLNLISFQPFQAQKLLYIPTHLTFKFYVLSTGYIYMLSYAPEKKEELFPYPKLLTGIYQ